MKLHFLRIVSIFVFSLLCICVVGSRPTDSRRIEINAKKFSFEPNEITIKKGESVTLVLHSEDATHGLVIDKLGVRAEVKKGQTEDIAVPPPTTTGTFEGKCAHFCGMGHGSMKFKVNVVE
jgi:cytochrome c oxidase subunit II